MLLYTILLAVVGWKLVESSSCCPDQPTVTVLEDRCANGKNFSLNCEGNGMFMMDPDIEYFRLINDTLIQPHDTGQVVINGTRFCTAYQVLGERKKEVVIVCFGPPDEDIGTSKSMIRLYSYCLLVSVLFLILTLVAYCLLPVLRDLQGKCVMCFVGSLAIAYFSLSIMQQGFLGLEVSSEMCVFSGFLTYFWLLCVFFWLHIISFNIWRSAVFVTKWPENSLWLGYTLFGFGGPTLLLSVALITHHIPGDHIKPNFNDMICWFPGKLETWTFFYGPMAILLICNIVYFFLTVIRLWMDHGTVTPQSRIRVLRFKLVLYLKLFLTMGISWIFEILSHLFDANWYVTDILNCLQGVIIFLVMVATRKKVLRAMANSKACAGYFSPSWQTMPDEESLEEVHQEQIQLS